MGEKQQRIYLSPPHMSGREHKYLDEAFATNWIAPLGPNVNAFEKELSAYVGCQGAVAVSSGTAALHLALILLGVAAGDKVFCSTLTFIASANPILYQGASPVFIDSEPETWNMSPKALERAFHEARKEEKLPKAMVCVNLYGQSADYERILEMADFYQVPVVEDAAESLGATYRGKASGTWGKFGVFSFNGNKIITTSGGGMLVSSDKEALERARFLATQARDPARYYQHSVTGYNYRMSNILAGIGRGQLEVLDERVRRKREIFDAYFQELASFPGIAFMPESGLGKTSRWLTTLTVNPEYGVSALDIMDVLEENNIESRPVWKPLHLQPVFHGCRYYPHQPGNHVAERLFTNGICLPSGTAMTRPQQQRVLSTIRSVLQKQWKRGTHRQIAK